MRNYIGDIIIGLDRATEEQFRHAQEFFSALPQRTHLLWNDGPRLRAVDKQLSAEGLSPQHEGKGRNAWFCFGYALALEHVEAVALHDCDIITYDRSFPARLFYPVANPTFSFEFCKGYYARIYENKLGGRLTRLFVTPLLRAMKKVVGTMDYLDFMDSFRYPLSGEFSLRRDFIQTVRIPGDWGLEVGMLSEVYRNLSRHHICQVDIADTYDHKHQVLSAEAQESGLVKMSVEIAKSLFRKLATEGVELSPECFRSIKASYFRIALGMHRTVLLRRQNQRHEFRPTCGRRQRRPVCTKHHEGRRIISCQPDGSPLYSQLEPRAQRHTRISASR